MLFPNRGIFIISIMLVTNFLDTEVKARNKQEAGFALVVTGYGKKYHCSTRRQKNCIIVIYVFRIPTTSLIIIESPNFHMYLILLISICVSIGKFCVFNTEGPSNMLSCNPIQRASLLDRPKKKSTSWVYETRGGDGRVRESW